MCGGRLLRSPDPEDIVTRIVTDSRTGILPEGSLFVALKGERHDGHHYLHQLSERGIKVFLISDMESIVQLQKDEHIIVVDDTLAALQQLAATHRKNFNIPVAAITGSNGKTIVKEWLSQLMPADMPVLRSPMSYNSQVGVPLSVLLLDTPYRIALFEAGISKPGEMEKLEAVIQPTIGIFTGIGAAHDEFFSSRREKTLEKLKLFRQVTDLICFQDDAEVFPLVLEMADKEGINLFTIGPDHTATVQYKLLDKNSLYTLLEVRWKQHSFTVKLPFSDEASIRNSLLCLATMLFLGCKPEDCPAKLSRLEPVAMRMEQVEGLQDCIVINDSYNNDLLALRMALDHLLHQQQRPRRTLILSDIFQSGLANDELLNHLESLLNTSPPDRFIGIGPVVKGLKGKLSIETWFYDTTEQFLLYHPLSEFSNEVILLKGARSFLFEQILERLQRKSHRTILEINLEALVHNLNFFKSKLKPETQIMAMVKASSYGAGNFEIASVLQFHRVDFLAVAYADEGVELRKVGIDLPVMVMNPEPGSFRQMIDHNLEPEIYSFALLESFARAVEEHYQATGVPYPVHIETDTGMHRLGFGTHQVPQLIKSLKSIPSLAIRSVFSHLATADDLSEPSFALEQIRRFGAVKVMFAQSFQSLPLFHILNSAGIMHFPDAQFNMVRPGIGLYGIAADSTVQPHLQQVFRLRSVVSQVRQVKLGESVGYNRSFIAPADLVVATIAIGYADGFSRKLGNGTGKVRIRGVFVPVIGDVCMDMIMVDVTSLPDVAEGDEAVIFDETYPVTELATQAGTIPYEVLTSIAARVKRVYLKENR